MVTKTSKAKTALKSFGATALMSAGAIGQMTVMQAVSADETTQVTAGSFDLTKQADKATFPVMFDRPSGVNAAALAGTVINLGTDSKLYQSAVKAVPELADQNKMANLLSNSLSTDATAKAEARATIVKLINWYNGLGGNPIKTQGGATYTAANLDEPINTLAVAFSDNKSINSRVSDTVTKAFANAKTVKDVMAIFDGYAMVRLVSINQPSMLMPLRFTLKVLTLMNCLNTTMLKVFLMRMKTCMPKVQVLFVKTCLMVHHQLKQV